MSPAMSNKFIPIDRDTPFVIPVQAWLSEDHLARFIVAMVDNLDVTALEAAVNYKNNWDWRFQLSIT